VQILQNKFEDFKHRIDANSGRFAQCDDSARRLIASENPYAAEFPAKQEQLRYTLDLSHFHFFASTPESLVLVLATGVDNQRSLLYLTTFL